MKRSIKSVIVVVLFLSGGQRATGAAQSVDDGVPSRLGLPEAEDIFLTRGLDLLIAQFGAEGAEGDVRAAGAHPNPGVDLSVLYTPQLNHGVLYPLGPMNSTSSLFGFSVGLNDNALLEDQLSGKRSLRIETASKALATAKLNVADVKRVELTQLRQAYAATVMARLNVEAAQDSFETFDKQLTLNRTRYDAGAINGLDLSRATQAQLEALQTLDQAKNGLQQAMASLMFLLGVRSGVPDVTLTSGIGFAELPRLTSASIASLDGVALENRTDVKIAVNNLEQAEVVVRQAKRARLPDIALTLGYSEQCNNTSCNSQPAFNAGLQGNVPVFYQQQGEIKRAQSNVLAAERNADKVKAQVLSDVTQAFASYRAVRSQVERMEGKLLEQAKVSRDLAQVMYQKGAASFIDFMDAQRQFVASRLEYNQDLANYWSAVYQLEQATATVLR
jgi:cobalt-zinc-cadmium efflux system outer membrane protein